MGTQVERSSAEKDLAKRGCGYTMPHYNIDGNDVDVVIDEMGKAVDRARRGEGPSYIVANTYRFRGHSMSDPMKYRTKEETGAGASSATRSRSTRARLREKGLITRRAGRRDRRKKSPPRSTEAVAAGRRRPAPAAGRPVQRHPGGDVSAARSRTTLRRSCSRQ